MRSGSAARGGNGGWGASGRMNRSGGGFSGWGDAGGGGGVRGGRGGGSGRARREATHLERDEARAEFRARRLALLQARAELRHLGRRRGGHLGVVVKSSRRARITVAWRLSSGPGKGARSTSPPEQGRGSVDGTIPAGRREKCAREVSEARSEARGAGRFRRPRRRKHRRAARAKRQSSSRHRAAAVFFIGGGGGGGALQSAAHVRRARSSTARRGIPEDPVERPLSPTT